MIQDTNKKRVPSSMESFIINGIMTFLCICTEKYKARRLNRAYIILLFLVGRYGKY